MRNDAGLMTDAGTHYYVAYEVHYSTKDLSGALQLYRDLVTAHPDTAEAGYAHAQIRNIAHAVVPPQELMDLHAELALTHLGHPGPA